MAALDLAQIITKFSFPEQVTTALKAIKVIKDLVIKAIKAIKEMDIKDIKASLAEEVAHRAHRVIKDLLALRESRAIKVLEPREI